MIIIIIDFSSDSVKIFIGTCYFNLTFYPSNQSQFSR